MFEVPLPAFRFARRAGCTAALLVTLACAAPLASAATDPAFELAVKSYRAGRFSDAYGKFIPLANNGNAQAARIALFMHAHGTLLYGTAWDASSEDVELWSRLTGMRPERQPGYDPLLPNPNMAGAPPQLQAQPRQVPATYRPRMTRFIARTEQVALPSR